MKESIKKLLRSIQVYFPYLQDLRFRTERMLRRAMRTPREEDFRALSRFPQDTRLLFVDVGANRGEAIESMLMMHGNSSVLAFEPNPVVCAKTERLFGGNKRVTLNNCGLSEQNGSLVLHVPYFGGFMFDGLASFSREEAASWLKGRIYGYSDAKLSIQEMRCPVSRLDDYGVDPFFIKIDVQGHEHAVLKGAQETLRRSKPVLLIESPSEEVTRFLVPLGYSPYSFSAGEMRPGTGTLNTFFLPEEKKPLFLAPRVCN